MFAMSNTEIGGEVSNSVGENVLQWQANFVMAAQVGIHAHLRFVAITLDAACAGMTEKESGIQEIKRPLVVSGPSTFQQISAMNLRD